MSIEHADFDGIERLALVLGGEIVSTFDNAKDVKLGHCKQIAEIMIGEDKLIHFSGACVRARACECVCACVRVVCCQLQPGVRLRMLLVAAWGRGSHSRAPSTYAPQLKAPFALTQTQSAAATVVVTVCCMRWWPGRSAVGGSPHFCGRI